MLDVEKARALVTERACVHGDIQLGQEQSGVLTAALLCAYFGKRNKVPPLPGYVNALLQCVAKIERALRPADFNEDNYLDAFNYLEVAYDMAREKQEVSRREIETREEETSNVI